jgi:lactate dehydrogenase-like 2-hydroxyacid dehydrogenase
LNSLKDIAVLVPGKLHPHARDRVHASFSIIELPSSDPALVTPDIAASVRGIASMTAISAALMQRLPKLEIVANFGVGYDAVDAGHAGKAGIMVTNTPDVLTEEVADTALGLLLNTVREFSAAERYLREGRWEGEGNYRLTPLTLRGRKAGIFGMGRIGMAIAKRLEAFGVSIAYHNRRPAEGAGYEYHADLMSLAAHADTLIVVVPGGESTRDAVNADVLKALGPDGVVINIGRGSTVDGAALAEALNKGVIAAAGLDVFKDEPRVPDALLHAPNCVLLPHLGSASVHTRRAMADLCVLGQRGGDASARNGAASKEKLTFPRR